MSDRRRRWKLARAKTSIGLTRRRSPWVFRALQAIRQRRRLKSMKTSRLSWMYVTAMDFHGFYKNTRFLIPVRLDV